MNHALQPNSGIIDQNYRTGTTDTIIKLQKGSLILGSVAYNAPGQIPHKKGDRFELQITRPQEMQACYADQGLI